MLKKVCLYARKKMKKLKKRIASIEEDIQYLKEESLSFTQISELEDYKSQLENQLIELDHIYHTYCNKKTSTQYELKFRGKRVEVLLVPDLLADPLNHLISSMSPLGKELENVNEGDILTVKTDHDQIRYKVSRVKTYFSP